MKLISAILFGVGMFVQIIFYLKREWLYKREYFLKIVLIALALFPISYLLLWLKIGDPKFVVVLKMPLYTAAIFYIMKTMYYAFFKKNAVDTYHSYDMREMKDGIFNMLFVIVSMFLPLILIHLF